ncbi:LysR family transcriptional regulator [Oceanobacter sp. 4_MG-2023]|uniref:LysR family transcriptional regulator n=2 Tax=Gammaproteobacteria TaxID=1236 RepID=UPI0027355F30|nr:LysR family transcriptional regulator [Oceanobacter sp. 4_MG-2023]MDP2548728.1 LysR family transcriptional regulator [Oceanobacter sp. 4_MG-2023]
MDYKALSYFYEVARQQSFTRAADRLQVAQPAVSMAIKRLEQQLQLTLFHRHERQISLTDEGECLFAQAQRIVQMMSDADLEMAELRGLEQGAVQLGTPSMLGSYHFPPIIMAFRHRYPNLTFSVYEGGAWQLQQMLEKGELDLAVIEAEEIPDSIEARTLMREEMRVVVAKDHPFASRTAITPAEFLQEDLVLFRKGYFHRKVIDRLAEESAIQPRINFETNLLPLIRSIVKQGFGISTLLRMATEDDPELVTLSFDPPIVLDLCLAWRKDGYLSKANQAFVDFVLDNSPASGHAE